MSNDYAILIVDSNMAFATLLKEGLEQAGEYRAAVTTNGDEALQMLSDTEYSLAIVDLGMSDPNGIELARALRKQKPDLRLMLIPLEGAELPPEAVDLGIQGILTKPFFLPELPGHVAEALTKPVERAAVAPGEEALGELEIEAPSVLSAEVVVESERMPEIVAEMNALAQEINAEAVILTGGGGLIAHAGRLSVEEMSGLAQAVAESWHTSARVARILGQEQAQFEQSMDGGEHTFYSLSVVEHVILSVAVRANIRLGMIRHRAKTTADALRPLISTGS